MFKSKKNKKHSLNQNIMSQENTTNEHKGVYRIKSIQWFNEKLLSHSQETRQQSRSQPRKPKIRFDKIWIQI
jgi:hypothetical protein